MEKVNITIELYIFKLLLVTNFALKKQFWILESNLPQLGISTNDGQIQSTFAQSYHIPSMTFTDFFLIAQYYYYFKVYLC